MKTADISGPVDTIEGPPGPKGPKGPVKPKGLKPKVVKAPKVTAKKTQGAEAILAENLAKVLAFLETYGRKGKRKVSKKA